MANGLPDFLGIGAVKASTTWLYRNLYQHPALYLPITKPVRYFDRHRDKPIETYKAIFKPAAGRLCGEFSASYSVLPIETIEYIHELMSDLKLIFLMREPKARAWSEANPSPGPAPSDLRSPITTSALVSRMGTSPPGLVSAAVPSR